MAVEITRPQEPQEEVRGAEMSFLDHLEELRKRIIHSLIAIAVALSVCWLFADTLFKVVSQPIVSSGAALNMLKPTEGFNLELKLAFLASVFLASPFILAQVWLFISPGL